MPLWKTSYSDVLTLVMTIDWITNSWLNYEAERMSDQLRHVKSATVDDCRRPTCNKGAFIRTVSITAA